MKQIAVPFGVTWGAKEKHECHIITLHCVFTKQRERVIRKDTDEILLISESHQNVFYKSQDTFGIRSETKLSASSVMRGICFQSPIHVRCLMPRYNKELSL